MRNVSGPMFFGFTDPGPGRGGVILLRLLDRQVARIEEAEDLLARSGCEGGLAGAGLACRRLENP